MTDAELREILDDESKTIRGDIQWMQNKTMSHAVDFRVRVQNDIGYVLWVKGSHNRELTKTSFILFSQDAGRLFAVDAGTDHRNRDCQNVGTLHLHKWDEITKDRHATAVTPPPSIDEDISVDPIALWRWFCREAKITHEGIISSPLRRQQLDLFDQ